MITFGPYCLRALEPSDIDALYFWENQLNSYSNHEQFFSRFTLENYIEQAHLSLLEAKQFRFVISLSDNLETCIGFIDLVDYEIIHNRVEIGILIDPKFRSKGIAKRALKEIEIYLKHKFQIKQVYCYVETDNQSSLNLFKTLNYSQVGILKAWRMYNSNWKDVYFFQKILS